jgi:hypothetical protein
MGGVMVVILAVALSLWPSEQSAWAVPVVVQDVSTADPERTVMVYSTPDQAPDQGLTVIWLFSSDAASEES